MTDLPAGPELDRLVAEKVMGWRLSSIEQPAGLYNLVYVYRDAWDALRKGWSPSTNIAHAMEVVTELEKSGLELGLCRFIDSYWEANFSIAERDGVSAKGETAQLAICRAALRCVP